MAKTVQAAFRDGNRTGNRTCKMVIMIPKGCGRNFMGICLVEVLWETATVLLDWRFTSTIGFHNVLHDFQAGFRTGTDSLNYKMI